jgi:hypothetical protein
MRQPNEVTAFLRARFDRGYPDWARGQGTWPMRIPLKPPTSAERSADPVACHAWAKLWDYYAGPGTVERSTLRFPTGLHLMPKTLVLRSPLAAASVDPVARETWRRCGERLTYLQRSFPMARFDRIIRRLTEMEADEYRRVTATVTWLDAHPTSGLLLRQLPIEGVDTKWLGKNKGLVLALLGGTDDPAGEVGGETDGLVSARMRLHERLGLRVPPELIQVAVLDPGLRAKVGGMRHFAASVDDLNASGLQPRTVVILENKETGYAITGDLADTVVFHGSGFSIVNYARVNWIRDAPRVIYWGDIDAPGLQFVSDLRHRGVAAHTILMDLATLEKYRHLAVTGAGPARRELPDLEPSEQQLYAYLVQHAADHGIGLLLEQERIPWAHAFQRLTDTISTAASFPASCCLRMTHHNRHDGPGNDRSV